MKLLRRLLISVFIALSFLTITCFAASVYAYAETCYEATIQSPTPFNGNGGEIIILNNGTVWKESSFQYLYLYSYNPSVTVCPSEGKMLLGKHRFFITPIGTQRTTSAATANTSGVIESRIDGEFKGWDGETIFKLSNGQIWQQASYSYTYHYAYSPKVLIYNAGGGSVMKVDGVDGTINVRRLK
jgi:hypothetical protein